MTRTYETTHPWINFQLDLREAEIKLWLLLGQAQAGCAHVAGMPLRPDLAQQLMKIYLAKGVLATTAIEGNTLTEKQVQDRIAGKLKLPPSKEYLGQEVDNIVEACNEIARNVILNEANTALDSDVIKRYNAVVLKALPLSDEDIIPGEFRHHQVGVGRYRGAPPDDVEYLTARLCSWLNSEFEGFETLIDTMSLHILKAIIAHIYIAWIHPFGDGNGRVARLVELQILLSAGIPMTAAHLLSNHYNETRSEYYRKLDHTHQHKQGILDFVEYALQGFVDNLEEQIQLIAQQQLQIHWRDYVYDCFKNKNSATDIRQRSLVLDLSKKEAPVLLSELRHISPRIAEAYAGKTDKTIQRDVNQLQALNLVEKTDQGVRANIGSMMAFLPPKRFES